MVKFYKLIENNFTTINKEKLSLYRSIDYNYYVVGKFYKEYEDKERFAVIADLSFKFKNLNSKQKQLKSKTFVIETVHVATDFRFKGIANKFYKYILKFNQLMCDNIQYEGAVELWKSLIECKDIVVWIYNTKEDKIISKATKLTNPNHI